MRLKHKKASTNLAASVKPRTSVKADNYIVPCIHRKNTAHLFTWDNPYSMAAVYFSQLWYAWYNLIQQNGVQLKIPKLMEHTTGLYNS